MDLIVECYPLYKCICIAYNKATIPTTNRRFLADVTIWGKSGPVHDTDFCWEIGLEQLLNKQLTWTIMPVYLLDWQFYWSLREHWLGMMLVQYKNDFFFKIA